MSSKAGFSWDGMKAGIGRAAQKAKEKVGKGDETVDVEFNHSRESFKKAKKDLQNLKEASDKILSGMKELNKSFGIFTESLVNLFPSDQSSHRIILELQRAMNGLDLCRQKFDERWKDDFLIPLSAYFGIFKEASSRIDERDRRRVDLDRYREDVRDLSEKAQLKDPNKLQLAKEKMYTHQEAFKDANQELIHDLPLIVADVPIFLEPVVGTVVNGFNEYYLGCSAVIADVAPKLPVIPQGQLDVHTNRMDHLLTTKEMSAIYKPISSYLPAAQAKMQEKAAAANAAGPGQGYSPAQPGAYPPSQPGAYPPPQPGAYPPQPGAYPPQPGAYPPQPGAYPPQPSPYPPQPGAYPPPQPQPGAYPGYPAQPPDQPPPYTQQAPSYPTPQPTPAPGAGGVPRAVPKPPGRGSIPPRPAIRAKALFPFQGQDHLELTFNAGDVLIIHSQNGDWWDAELNGVKGAIPSNYVQLLP